MWHARILIKVKNFVYYGAAGFSFYRDQWLGLPRLRFAKWRTKWGPRYTPEVPQRLFSRHYRYPTERSILGEGHEISAPAEINFLKILNRSCCSLEWIGARWKHWRVPATRTRRRSYPFKETIRSQVQNYCACEKDKPRTWYLKQGSIIHHTDTLDKITVFWYHQLK